MEGLNKQYSDARKKCRNHQTFQSNVMTNVVTETDQSKIKNNQAIWDEDIEEVDRQLQKASKNKQAFVNWAETHCKENWKLS